MSDNNNDGAEIKAMNAARNFPENTCPASRHTAMIAEHLLKGDLYPMLSEEPSHCGGSLASTVTSLWIARSELAALEAAAVVPPQEPPLPVLPKEPPPGLLMSMAIRYDHGLGLPGYYDSLPTAHGLTHAMRLESTLRTMRQLYEEVSGHGFYSAARTAEYAAAALKLAQPPSETKEGSDNPSTPYE